MKKPPAATGNAPYPEFQAGEMYHTPNFGRLQLGAEPRLRYFLRGGEPWFITGDLSRVFPATPTHLQRTAAAVCGVLGYSRAYAHGGKGGRPYHVVTAPGALRIVTELTRGEDKVAGPKYLGLLDFARHLAVEQYTPAVGKVSLDDVQSNFAFLVEYMVRPTDITKTTDFPVGRFQLRSGDTLLVLEDCQKLWPGLRWHTLPLLKCQFYAYSGGPRGRRVPRAKFGVTFSTDPDKMAQLL